MISILVIFINIHKLNRLKRIISYTHNIFNFLIFTRNHLTFGHTEIFLEAQPTMSKRQCTRYSLYWEETECLSYYEMLSLHEIFEIVGSQLTETDVEVLSFLLDEIYPGQHPLDPEGWTEGFPEGPDGTTQSNVPCPRLLKAWRRIQPQNESCPIASRHRPKSGVELLLELERRGYINEENLKALFQLLRILTRHDVLPFVSRKKRRTGKNLLLPKL